MTLISNFKRLFVPASTLDNVAPDDSINTSKGPSTTFTPDPKARASTAPSTQPLESFSGSELPKKSKSKTSFFNNSKSPSTNSFGSAHKSQTPLTIHSSKSSASPSAVPSKSTLFSISTPLNDLYPDLPSSYRLISLLGEGAFSTVYKALDTSNDDATVAIKVIAKDNLSPKQLNNIKNEISIMHKSGDHPNILKLLHYIDTQHHCFLILEYCNGGEIFNKIIEYTYFSESLSKHVFKQLLSAIEHLHDHNIAHRDIKPENLLFQQIPYVSRPQSDFAKTLRKSDDATKIDEGAFIPNVGGGTIGVIKLADFGLAKSLPNRSASSALPSQPHISNLKTPCGTAGYTAPEVITCNTASSPNEPSSSYGLSSFAFKRTFPNPISRKNYYSKSVDIWSLGCFLYTILCGFPPFYDDDPNQLTMKILHGDFEYLTPWWDEISGDAKDLISQMININPETRISIDEIWQHPWVRGEGKNQGQNYFGESTANTYHKYEVHELDPCSKDNEVEHVEYASSSNSPLHTDNLYAHPIPPPSDNTFFGTCGPQPLASPRAEAIKRVFDNPAMLGSRASASVSGIDATAELVTSGEEFSAKHKSSVVQFIEDINDLEDDDEDEENDDEDDQDQDEESDNSDATSFSSSSDDHFVARARIPVDPSRKNGKLPKTPNPTKDELRKLNFKDVFKIDNLNPYLIEEEGEKSEKDDKITSLNTNPSARRRNSSKGRSLNSSDSTTNNDEDGDLSSTNSLTDGDENEHDYQTRSSSIISGINGDFKFTLNLNDSNLLSRRRSSTISKSLKKSNSNNSPPVLNSIVNQNELTTSSTIG